MRRFFKMLFFYEFITVIMSICVLLVIKLIGLEAPLILIPIAMGCIAGAVLFGFIIEPLGEWWFKD